MAYLKMMFIREGTEKGSGSAVFALTEPWHEIGMWLDFIIPWEDLSMPWDGVSGCGGCPIIGSNGMTQLMWS
jgi:hypothetical protein